MSNIFSDMIGKFVEGMLDNAVRKFLTPYVGAGKLTSQDVTDIVTGVHAEVKLALLMQANKPAS